MNETYNLEDLYNTLLALEETGAEVYAALAKVSNPASAAIFQHLAKQEQKHWTLYARLKQHAGYSDVVDVEYAQYISSLIASSMKTLREPVVSSNRDAALQKGIQLEKETLLFLGELTSLVGEPHRSALVEIVKQERSHLLQLQELVMSSHRESQ